MHLIIYSRFPISLLNGAMKMKFNEENISERKSLIKGGTMKNIIWIIINISLTAILACGGGGGGGGSTGDVPSFTVTYSANNASGGDVPLESKSFKPGQTVTVQGNTGNLVKSGADFNGWNTTVDGTGTTFSQGSTFVMGKNNVTLFAKWTTSTTYSVTYDCNGNTGGGAPSDSTRYLNSQSVTVLPNDGGLSKSGFSFIGWNTSKNGTGIAYTQGQTFNISGADVVLYAMWSMNPTFTVSYDGNGNSSGSIPVDLTNYEQGQNATVLGNTGNLEKYGFVFSRWNTEADGSGKDYNHGDTMIIGNSNAVLYAVWVPVFTVTYKDNGSTEGDVPIDVFVYRQGDTVTVYGNSGNLVKDGYTFAGWSIVEDGNGTTYNQDQQFIMGGADVTLFAKWTLIPTFRVTFNGNGNETGDVPVDTTNYQQGAVVTVPGNTGDLAKSGFNFTGWNTQADGSGTAFTQGDTFNMSAADITLFAQWTAKPVYTVTYNGNGSDNLSVPVDSTSYLEGAEVTVLGNINSLVKAGYAFNGWNAVADGSGTAYMQNDRFNIGKADVELYAQWIKNPSFTVTYDGNGNTGGSVPVDTASYEESQTVTVAGNTGNLTKNHSVFAGWNTQQDGNGKSYVKDDTFTIVKSNVTLYAQWATAYTVTYDGNGNTGGAVPVDPNNYTPGQIATVLGNSGMLSQTGSSFTGWNTSPDGTGVGFTSGNIFTMSASNVILYAQWTTLPVYTVTYNGNGNTGGSVPFDSTNYLDGQSFTVMGNTGGLEKTGSHFTGWNTASNGSGTSFTQRQSGDIAAANVVLYAQWTTNPTYTVTYNSNGAGSGNAPVDTTNYVTGQTVTVFENTGNLVDPGHAFSGWNTKADGSGIQFMPGSTFSMGSSDVTLYAQWDTAFTVTYNGNGNTAGTVPVDGISYVSGDSATVLGNTTLVKDGYTFNGWTTSPDGSGTVCSQGSSLVLDNSSVILYARWTSLPVFNVIYDGNGNTGGTVPVDSTNYISGQTATVLPNSGLLVKTLYTFAGWNTKADGSGITFAPDTTITVTGKITLFAKWTPKKAWYSITSSGDGVKLGAVVYNEKIYGSSDSGSNWGVINNTSKKWYSITSSSDGTKLAAVASSSQIYISSDSGATWTAKASSKSWRTITSSADGTKLAAAVSNGYIWTSADSGLTWTERTSSASASWRSITGSTDGTKLAAVVRNGQIYTSSNSGISWSSRASVRNWYGITSSADGSKLAAVVNNGQIYISSDSGATWTARATSKSWRAIASSSDGTKLVAVVNGGQIWTSADSGVTWTARGTTQSWYGVASSSDGTKLAAVSNNGAIYTSTDSGATWIAR